MLDVVGTAIDDALLVAWRGRVERAGARLGWTVRQAIARRHAGGVLLAITAPLDLLLLATEVNEWALCASLVERDPLRWSGLQEALVAEAAAAAEDGVSVLLSSHVLAELEKSASILKVSDVETLGYHDSGMEEWDYKSRPDAFSNVPLETVAGRIGELITKYRPQVLVTYDDAGAYQHPDHVHASRAAQAAAAATGIPAKVYLSTMKGSNWRKIWDALRAAGEEVPNWDDDSPEARDRWQRGLESEARITTTVDIRPVLARKRAALFAHGSQINDSWFSKIPPEIAEQAFGYEYFIRKTDTTGAPLPETDLFAGLRGGA